MKLKVHKCKDGDYDATSIPAKLEYKLLYLNGNTKGIEVELIHDSEVYGHSKDSYKFNFLLKDKDETLEEDDRKHFVRLNYFQKQVIFYQFRNRKPLLYLISEYSFQFFLILSAYLLWLHSPKEWWSILTHRTENVESLKSDVPEKGVDTLKNIR